MKWPELEFAMDSLWRPETLTVTVDVATSGGQGRSWAQVEKGIGPPLAWFLV